MNRLIISLLLILVLGCKDKLSRNDTGDSKKSDQGSPTKTVDCYAALRKLIFTSNYSPLGEVFDNDSLGFTIRNDVYDDHILIRIVNLSASTEYTEMTLGWLKLDLVERTVSDITIEDSVVVLKVDKTQLDFVIKNCSKESQLYPK